MYRFDKPYIVLQCLTQPQRAVHAEVKGNGSAPGCLMLASGIYVLSEALITITNVQPPTLSAYLEHGIRHQYAAVNMDMCREDFQHLNSFRRSKSGLTAPILISRSLNAIHNRRSMYQSAAIIGGSTAEASSLLLYH